MLSSRIVCCIAMLLPVPCFAQTSSDAKPARKPGISSELSSEARRDVKDVARLAYVAVFDGWSTDEVLLQDELNSMYLTECRRRLPDVPDFDFNWSLLNLRKAGGLTDIKTTRRRSDQSDEHIHAAEIAARFLEDRHGVNTDRVMCEPELRAEYDRVAKVIAPDVDRYLLRKACFTLRKSRRLQPELVLRVAEWDKTVSAYQAAELADKPSSIPTGPGVYIFRDAKGYLYIGESSNLRERLTKHLDRSDRQSLASYLATKKLQDITVEIHAFDPDSPARLKTMRRAYESELIRSRKPKLNLAP
jgi:predicted GIY-YIG superfamily endonuclease